MRGSVKRRSSRRKRRSSSRAGAAREVHRHAVAEALQMAAEREEAADAARPARVERAQHVVADAAVLELLREVPGPELARRGVGVAQEGLRRPEEGLGRNQAGALESLAVGEIPRERALAQEALEIRPHLVLEGLEAGVVPAQHGVVLRVQTVVVRLLLVEDVDLADQLRVGCGVEALARELLDLDQIGLEVGEHRRSRIELMGVGGGGRDPARGRAREVELRSPGLHASSDGPAIRPRAPSRSEPPRRRAEGSPPRGAGSARTSCPTRAPRCRASSARRGRSRRRRS